MVVKQITHKLVDVFMDAPNPHPTGFEANIWLRLQKRQHGWTQVAGVRVPAYMFKQIIESLK